MAKIIGDSPKPWALTIGVDPESALARELEHMFATVTPVDDLNSIRQLDYDAAIVVNDQWQQFLEGHLQVVWFADSGIAPVRLNEVGVTDHVSQKTYWTNGDHASRFAPTLLASEEGVAALVERLAPPAAGEYNVLSQTSWLADFRQPLLLEVGGKQESLAAIYDRHKGKKSEVWCLPARAMDEGSSWVSAALQRWRRRFPEAFPVADWAEDQRWQTAEEQVAQAALTTHDAETVRLVDARRVARVELEAAAQQASAAAAAGARRLLTTNGDALVEAVVEALEPLGFDVTQSDDVLPPGQKREDLLVEEQEWVSVTEIKGYEKGNAKQNDLLQLGNAVESYLLRTGQRPAARWYIINQSFRTAPDLRPRPLAGTGDTIEKFIDQQGLVIDTRDLFSLTQAVQTGQLAAGDARQLFRDARGVFEYLPATTNGRELEAGPQQLALPPGTDQND